MIVEDVIYDTAEEDQPNLKVFRRLTFGRSSGLVQSEALLSENILQSNLSAANKKGKVVSSRSRKKGGQKRSESHKLIHGNFLYMFSYFVVFWFSKTLMLKVSYM